MPTKQRRKNQYGLWQDERNIWHCDFSVAGKRVQRSTFTEDRAAAEEWCASTASGLWRERKLGEAPEVTWDVAVAEWFKVKEADGLRSIADARDKAMLLAPHFDGKLLHTLTSQQFDNALDAMTHERGWTGATRNRHREWISSVLNFARRKKWRVADIEIEERDEPDGRIRWLSKEEAPRLLTELPIHLHRMAEFSLMTGLRQANVTGLRWAEVDLERRICWVWADSAKGKRHLSIPLNSRAVAILRECKTHGDVHYSKTHCFTYFGKPVLQPNGAAWYKACERAGLGTYAKTIVSKEGEPKRYSRKWEGDFRWHDLRHTWASWHVMGWMSSKGIPTPLPVLQKLGGWASLELVLRYAHLTPDHTAAYAGDIEIMPQQQPAPQLTVVEGGRP